jgi:hypothetical protein
MHFTGSRKCGEIANVNTKAMGIILFINCQYNF